MTSDLEPVRADEYEAVGALVVRAYEVGGVIDDDDGYRSVLADTAGRAATADVYVAHDDDGRPVATVTLSPYGTDYAQVAGPGELEFRMLAVDPDAAGRGLGSRLVTFCAERAAATGHQSLVLCVIDTNAAAIRLYRRLGFTAQPERDITPAPGVRLLVFTRAAPSAAPPAEEYVGDPAVRAEWDRRYSDRDQMWSGRPNGALVAEVVGLTPGRVLDVGCGEGADAVWLARAGWDVTALEVSGVALARAAGHARDAGVSVRWVHAGLAEAELAPGSFDLVSAQYPALLRTPDSAAERALLAAVAAGGLLLLVHHAGMDTQHAHDSGFDPADYVWPSMVAALLDDDWHVELDEQRPRVAPESGAGAHPVDDVVLRARRLR